MRTSSNLVRGTNYMLYELKFPDWEQRVIHAASSTPSATAAAKLLGIKYDTYKRYALKYGCFETNQSGKGRAKPKSVGVIPTEDIVVYGLHPQYQSNKLRIRLIEEGWFEAVCSCCGLETWLGKPIPLELDHIDGVHSNNLLTNLRLMCPNCHAFTPTYRGKNIGKLECQ